MVKPGPNPIKILQLKFYITLLLKQFDWPLKYFPPIEMLRTSEEYFKGKIFFIRMGPGLQPPSGCVNCDEK